MNQKAAPAVFVIRSVYLYIYVKASGVDTGEVCHHGWWWWRAWRSI